MKYYGNITSNLQLILVKRWVKNYYSEQTIADLVGEPVNPSLPYPLLIKELTGVEL